MPNFRKPWKRRRGIEAELAELRAEAPDELVRSLAARMDAAERPAGRKPLFRLALAGGIAAALLVPMAALGGFGQVASVATDAADAVGSLIASSDDDVIDVDISAGSDQYQEGFSWGDPGQNHDGPPGLVREGGDLAPPLVARCDGDTARVVTTVVLDEQAVLRMSVRTGGGKKLLLAQAGDQEPKRTIVTRIYVPRALRLDLRIPCGVLETGKLYRLVLRATDPDGNESTLVVPFRAVTATT
jgi:hypothetical protein